MQNTEHEDIANRSHATVQVALGVIADTAGNILIALRAKHVHQGGLWEFPGGKVEAGESAPQALVRELNEELAITVHAMTPLLTINHQYTDLKLRLEVFTVDDFAGQVTANEGQEIRWVAPQLLAKFPFPEASYRIVNAVSLPAEYAILSGVGEDLLAEQLTVLWRRGVRLIQARINTLTEASVLDFFAWAAPWCSNKGVVLLVNSAVKGAPKVTADGLHLTATHLLALKQRPPQYAWVGASCHNLRELQQAQLIGVDFVVLGPVLPTATHPNAKPLGWAQFQRLATAAKLPVFALGGLKQADQDTAKMAGAHGIAGISAWL